MADTDPLSPFARLRQRLAEWLRTYRPTPRTYITAACAGATVAGPAIAGSSEPTAMAAAGAALGAQLGVNPAGRHHRQPARTIGPHRRAHATLGRPDASGEEFSLTLKKFVSILFNASENFERVYISEIRSIAGRLLDH